MTAFLFAMDYRLFYSRWHAPFGTIVWAFQFVFTSASAVYQFAVLGMRLFCRSASLPCRHAYILPNACVEIAAASLLQGRQAFIISINES